MLKVILIDTVVSINVVISHKYEDSHLDYCITAASLVATHFTEPEGTDS